MRARSPGPSRTRPWLRRSNAAAVFLVLALLTLALYYIAAFTPLRARLFKTHPQNNNFFTGQTLTSFGAVLTTDRLTFQTKELGTQGDEAGLFASGHLLDVDIVGCSSLTPLAGAPQSLPCTNDHLSLKHVALDSVTLPQLTRVDLSIQEKRLHVRLDPSVEGKALFRVVLAASSSTRTLAPGQWLVNPTNLGLEVVLSPLPAIPEESTIPLADHSSVFFESNGASALIGEHNNLLIAKTKNSIPLKESRLVLEDLHSARIRRLAVKGEAELDPHLEVILSGQSPTILVYSNYTDVAANEALSGFDSLFAARTTRSLATNFGLLAILFTALQTIYSALQFHKKSK